MQVLLLCTPEKEYIQDSFNRSLVSAKKKVNSIPPPTLSSTAKVFKPNKEKPQQQSPFSLPFPFRYWDSTENLQPNHKNWQTWGYLQYYELHYASEI